MRNLDKAYWDDVICATYVEGGFGKFEDAIAKVKDSHPEFREFLDQAAVDKATRQQLLDFVNRLKSRFAEADRNEHELPNPTPPHLRAQFLPFAITLPPMPASLNAYDGQGRLPSATSTLKQHKRHRAGLKQFHARGHAYQQTCETQVTDMVDDVRDLLPNVEHPENLTLAEILTLLKKRDEADVEIDAASAAPAL